LSSGVTLSDTEEHCVVYSGRLHATSVTGWVA